MLNQYQMESHAISSIQNYLFSFHFVEGTHFYFSKRNISTFPTDFIVLQTNSPPLLSQLHQFSIVKSIFKNAKYQLPPTYTFQSSPLKRKLLLQKEITEQMQAQVLWSKGFFGENIKVAVLDTGLRENHNAFETVEERINFTNEESVDDLLGHGTFVAGVIASRAKECKGFAPKVSLNIYKVFTGEQVSYTSWFIDAFNYAIQNKINIINLSIGGPDTQDQPFIDKVHEAVANQIIVVSAIGNDGPLYGTLNNPADLSAVIGVGGIDDEDEIASFSSRGATTWELNHGGYGRMKPDFVTYGNKVKGTARYGACNILSGTSVAAPVITGMIALLASTVPEEKRWKILNPASIKQLLQQSAEIVPNANVFEQGMGKVNLIRAFELLQNQDYKQTATFFPPSLDFTNCPYMWPFCTQHIYHTAMPLIVNVTILNPLSLTGRIIEKPKWVPSTNGKLISVSFSFPDELWPFSGYLAIHIVATEWSRFTEGIVEGNVVLPFESINGQTVVTEISLPLRLKVIKTPSRMKRLLWDQYHNIQYPPKYVPRDNLNNNDDVLDWNGDHPHTNFKDLFNHLRNQGYFLEVLNGDLTTFDASNYAALLLVDIEDEFTIQEREKLQKDVEVRGLSLVVLAEWYNVEVMKKAQFYDENTKKLWIPITGGANVPALNGLLEPFGITLGASIYNGELLIDTPPQQQQEGKTLLAAYYSGSSIIRFPEGGMIIRFNLEDQTRKILYGQHLKKNDVPVIGFYQHFKGRIVVFGDTSCVDAVQRGTPFCGWLVDQLLDYAIKGSYPHLLHPNLITLEKEYISQNAEFPLRNSQSELPEVTKVPPGQVIVSATPHPLLNSTNYEHAYMIEEMIRIRRVKLFIPVLLMFAVVILVIILSIKRRRRIVYRALLRSDRRSFSQDFDQSDDI